MGKQFRKYLQASLLLFGVFSLPFSAAAQTLIPFTLYWKNATFILVSSDTLHGFASLTMPEDLIRLSQPDGSSATYLPSEVKSFIVEEPYNAVPFRRSGDLLLQNRRYGQYLWNRDKDFSTYKAPALFVVVVPGKYALLLREHKEQLQNAGGPTLAGQALGAAVSEAQKSPNAGVAERFYLSVDGQEVHWLRTYKKDLLAHFPGKEAVIKKFAQKYNLQFNRVDHLARIVAFCNTL